LSIVLKDQNVQLGEALISSSFKTFCYLNPKDNQVAIVRCLFVQDFQVSLREFPPILHTHLHPIQLIGDCLKTALNKWYKRDIDVDLENVSKDTKVITWDTPYWVINDIFPIIYYQEVKQ
jgi:hypothetical protein